MARLTLNPSSPSLCPGAFAPYTAACMAADFVAHYQGTGRHGHPRGSPLPACVPCWCASGRSCRRPTSPISSVTSIDNDGRVTLVLPVLATVFALGGQRAHWHWRRGSLLLVACIALTGVVAVNDVQRLDVGGLSQLVEIGVTAGPYLALIVGVVGLITSSVGLGEGVMRR